MDFDRDAVLTAFVAETQEGLDLMEQSLLAMESSSGGAELLDDIFRVAHTLKGNATSLELGDLASFAHATEDLLDVLREQNTDVSAHLISLLLKAVDELRALLAATSAGTPRLTAEQQQLRKQIAQEVAGRSQRVVAPHPTGERATTATAGTLPGNVSRTLRTDIDKLDRMLNLTGEIVIAQGRLRRMIEKIDADVKCDLLEMQGETERLFRDLQDEVMKVRMVPIGTMLRQNLRSVRDLANSHSKLARVEVSGGDVEVDTTVLEHLKDAVLHMIRNAIDHGIEAPPVRKSRGKNPCGVIKVSAAHIGGNVVVTLQDDGAGPNRAKILRKAKEMGLFLNPNPSDSELYQVLFQPGFSTAESVTDLSGRGVGLDVVRRNVEALHGTVDIAGEEGRGTTVTIRLPLTLAIIDGFSVVAGKDTFVVPQQYVVECTQITAAAHGAPASSGILNLRGSAVPYIRLREVFGQSRLGQSMETPARENVIVVKVGEFLAGIAVDQLLGGMQAVVKPLGKVFRGISGVAGSTILGDGRVGLVLDVPGLLQGMMQSSLQPQIG